MTIVTLVKVVPELERMSFDPATKTMRRAGAPLELNPFDELAAITAASLRSNGEDSVIVSMGPPDAKGPLLRAVALGATRALLVSDRVLAGSDTWVTSRVLAAAVRPLKPDVVLAGRWSTDSSTGQVPSQLADLLDMPMVSGARKITRTSRSLLEVVGETESGWERFRVETPCLISVTEKISKMRFPKPKEIAEAERRPFEVEGASTLALSPSQLGLAGSPTQVLSLENEEPSRQPALFQDGTLSDRVRQAAERVRELLARPHASPPPLRTPRTPVVDSGEVLVLASSGDGGLDPESLPLVSEVLRRPEPLWPAVVGFGPLSSEDQEALARAGAVRAYWWPDARGWTSAQGAARLLEKLLPERSSARGALFLSTAWAREVAGRVSGRLGLGLTGDAIGFDWEDPYGLVFHKPSFGGGLVARVISKHSPSLATIRPGSLAAGTLPRIAANLAVEARAGKPTNGRLERIESGSDQDPKFGDLDHARTVVGVGMGIGGPQNVDPVLGIIRPVGAALGATRRVVDEGWVPVQLQVGLTGKSIAPDLYIAVGVSGQTNHLVGVKRARVTVGINTRADAPLFQRVDVGIVGDGLEALRALVHLLASSSHPSIPGSPLAPPSAPG